ncbi:circumsporozoite protein-like [Oryza brachyantha]|uniref:circumsporozoite protein-like n=1 Tax=Oryza brachyantha TaxID=4533 RepID=UPI001ADBF200|nr:circumsporozoite protein-like [Oryza brachyantha]
MSCFGMGSGSSNTGWPLSSPSPARSGRRRGVKPWRWWRRCAGLAAAIHSKIRRRVVRWPDQGVRRRRRPSVSSSLRDGWCHHRSFAPVYIDELYSHPTTHHVAVHEVQLQQQSTSAGKNASATAATTTIAGANGKAPRPLAANNGATAAATNNAGAYNVAGTARAAGGKNDDAAATTTIAAANGKAPRALAANNGATAAATNNVAGARAAGGKNAAGAASSNGGGGKARGGVRSLLMSPLRGGVAGGGMGEVDVRAELFIRKFREEMRLQSQKSAEEFHAMLARGL